MHREKNALFIPLLLCSFVCSSIQKVSADNVVLRWPRIYLIGTQAMQRKDLRGITCPGGTGTCSSIQNIPLNLSCSQMSVSLDGAPQICPYPCCPHVWVYSLLLDSCPSLLSSALYFQNLKGHHMIKLQLWECQCVHKKGKSQCSG